ncbi:hypothetical protein Q3G72_000606 [Acer saccharum]|nr:hypothetical protein Q3G72_000606 [Acer saccharum]
MRDFKDSLVSIFVDNLNPKVDQVGLWGIFKPFGWVRDVFLSGRTSSRGSRFAFVRFATTEEASRVARMTNDMQVYGWSVSVKIETFGCKNRRTSILSENRSTRRTTMFRETSLKFQEKFPRNGENGGDNLKTSTKVIGTFVEAVEMNLGGEVERGRKTEAKLVRMSWDDTRCEVGGLSNCVVRVLKDFSSVSATNARLSSKGFSFSSNYLGGKKVLWQFEYEYDNIGFINNMFYWDDCFLTMERWSMEATPLSKPMWIEVFGVPLNC